MPPTLLDDAAALIRELEHELPRVTGFLPLPNPVDATCSRLIALYLDATPAGQAALRAAGTPEQYRIFLTFCDRMVVLCVRRHDERLLLESLVAHALEDFRWDPRENLLRLALVHHSAGKLGVDAAALVERVAGMASPQAADYLRRPPLSLASCGIREVLGPDGFSYERSW